MTPAGWETKPLGEVCHVYQSQTLAVKDLDLDGPFPVYGANGRIGTHSSYNHEDSELVLGCRGSVGSVIRTEPKSWINGNAMVVRPFPGVSVEYLRYALMGGIDIKSAITGTAQPQITRKSLSPIPIPLPPLEEQKRIVEILDAAFADIDEVERKTGTSIRGLESIFRDALQETFDIPGDGWTHRRITDVCTLKSGTSWPKSMEQEAGALPYVKVGDMNLDENANGIVTSSRFVDQTAKTAAATFPVGTTIFPKRGGAIATNKKRITKVPICADLNVMGVSASAALLPDLLFYYFLGIDLRDISNGSSIPQINNYSLEPLTISFPEARAEQQSLVDRLMKLSGAVDEACAIRESKVAAITDLRESLLQRAFSGQL